MQSLKLPPHIREVFRILQINQKNFVGKVTSTCTAPSMITPIAIFLISTSKVFDTYFPSFSFLILYLFYHNTYYFQPLVFRQTYIFKQFYRYLSFILFIFSLIHKFILFFVALCTKNNEYIFTFCLIVLIPNLPIYYVIFYSFIQT